MRTHSKGIAVALVLAVLGTAPSGAHAWNRGRARVFATLPAGSFGPEGLEVDAKGHVYVATFDLAATPPASGKIHVFDEHGRPVRQLSVAGASPLLLGLRFHPDGKLLVADFGGAQVLAVDPVTGASSPFMTLPALPHPDAGSSLNDITLDRAGNVYVSDSFQGIVWRTGPAGGVATVWVDSPLLRTSGVPPFGANGLGFDRRETTMYVANTGDDRVIAIPAAPGASGPVAGAPSVFANSVNGADGLLVDDDGNVWVAANQADEIVVIDPTGKAIAKLGDFGGRIVDGAPSELLFPASLRFLGNEVLVTNLALDLRRVNGTFVSVDSQWAAQVTRFTVSRLPARLRGHAGGSGGR